METIFFKQLENIQKCIFLEGLLKWWSGSRTFKDLQKYPIITLQQKLQIKRSDNDNMCCWWTDFVSKAIHNPVAIKLLTWHIYYVRLFFHRKQIL